MVMSNTAQAKKEMLRRAMEIHEEMDDLKEVLKDFYEEVKAREDELGFSPKELKDAVALLRKGPRKTVEALNQRLNFLRECEVQDAVQAAFE